MKLAGVILMAAAVAAAEAPLVNQGKPMRVAYECAEEDIQTLGLDCSPEDPCAVFLELTGLEIAGSKIFVSGNLHTAATTLYSILLASEDEGRTWSEPHARIRSASLDQIQFLDFERGWVSGQQLTPLPRDPFFLLTTDGGRTWRRQAVFSEAQAGSVEQFWFDSRTDGVAVIDRMQATETGARYSMYESRTGGESWMIREVSARPMKLKRAAGQDPERRLRADAATKSFVIERRQPGGWRAVASFLIQAGACRPQPPVLAEPPPEPPAEPAQPIKPPAANPRPRTPPSLKKKP